MERNEVYLNDVLNQSGPEQLDYLGVNLRADSLLREESSDQGGLIDSLLHKRSGSQVDGVGQFTPGSDAAHNLDIRASYASDKPMARKVIDQAAPARMHVVLDQPERHKELTGDYSPHKLGGFALSLCGRISEIAGSEIAVYQSDGESAGLLYEGYANDLYDVYNQIEGNIDRRFIERAGSAALSGTLRLVEDNIDHENDALFVVSDYLGEYEQEADNYTWQNPLRQLHEALEDRMWAIRIASQAQERYPALAGEIMSYDAIAELNRDFAALAETKQRSLSRSLAPFTQQNNNRLLIVNTLRESNEKHPVQAMSAFVLGETA